MSKKLTFHPFPLIRSNHFQTILGCCFIFSFSPVSQTQHLELADRDMLAFEVTTPRTWKPTDPTVVMIHGLCGSHKSVYLIRMTKKLKKRGIRAVRVNLRGCGSGRGLAKKIYHCGQSDDIFQVINFLKQQNPLSPIILVGFSLGGSLVLKLTGELEQKAKDYLHAVIAVNPPLDLYQSACHVGDSANGFYEKYFLRLMKEDLDYRMKMFPEIPPLELSSIESFIDFDESYTAPHYGFINAMDYYQKCSARNFLATVSIPCHILYSQDDPIVASGVFDISNLPENVQIFHTERGGHMGYLGFPGKGGFHWMDSTLIKWICEGLDWKKSGIWIVDKWSDLWK